MITVYDKSPLFENGIDFDSEESAEDEGKQSESDKSNIYKENLPSPKSIN